MDITQANIASNIDVSKERVRLGETAKNLIRHKIILAWILKECVGEFRGFDVVYIANNCIGGEIKVNQDMPSGDAMAVGANTEDLIDYDILFEARVPVTEKLIGLAITIENQDGMNLGYPIVTRAIYNLARLVSSQKGIVFFNSDYGKLQKVYSIWICPDPSNYRKNSYEEYGFTQQKAIGFADEPVQNYDKMKTIILCLNDDGTKSEMGIIRMLSTLLSTTMPVDKRKQILQKEFDIPMTKEIEEEMQGMCNYGYAIAEYNRQLGFQIGKKIGEERVFLIALKNLISIFKMNLQDAMNIINIPVEEQPKYMEMLQSQTNPEEENANAQ